jgi:nitric oxide reductase activation protein
MGIAMRHAGFELEGVRASRKILLVLTDGAPSDIDVSDPLDLVEDAARVTRQLRRRGIDVFGVVIDEAGLARISQSIGASGLRISDKMFCDNDLR